MYAASNCSPFGYALLLRLAGYQVGNENGHVAAPFGLPLSSTPALHALQMLVTFSKDSYLHEFLPAHEESVATDSSRQMTGQSHSRCKTVCSA